jgi:hypothetical protein
MQAFYHLSLTPQSPKYTLQYQVLLLCMDIPCAYNNLVSGPSEVCPWIKAHEHVNSTGYTVGSTERMNLKRTERPNPNFWCKKEVRFWKGMQCLKTGDRIELQMYKNNMALYEVTFFHPISFTALRCVCPETATKWLNKNKVIPTHLLLLLRRGETVSVELGRRWDR